MRVLVACEFSGTVREAFASLGWDAWSCDLLPTERPGQHFQGDVRMLLSQHWDLLIGHPPCTYLCRSGWHWVNKPDNATHPLKGEPRRKAALEAAEFFRLLLFSKVKLVAIENPLPISHVNLPPCTQIIHPWQFGHPETKATGLWLQNLPPLVPTSIVDGREHRIHRLPPGPNRSKERSRTFQGIADAMASQWTEWILNPKQPLLALEDI